MVDPHGSVAGQVLEQRFTSEPALARDALRRSLRQPLPQARPASRRPRPSPTTRSSRSHPSPSPCRACSTPSTASRTSRTTCCTGSFPSRYCESDVLLSTAWELFGATPRGVERVQAVCDWIHANVAYGVASIQTTTTVEIFERRGGMCRDFAHLGVTLLPRARHSRPLRVRLHAGHRDPRPVPADGLPRLVRGLARRPLVDVRRALQHAAHRPAPDRQAVATPPTSP